MKKSILSIFLLLFSCLLVAQDKSVVDNNDPPTFYFYAVMYGFNNDVYVSEIYDLEIERSTLFKETDQRLEKISQYLVDENIVSDVQTGYEKNYYKKDQAQNERNYIIEQLEYQKFKVFKFNYQ